MMEETTSKQRKKRTAVDCIAAEVVVAVAAAKLPCKEIRARNSLTVAAVARGDLSGKG